MDFYIGSIYAFGFDYAPQGWVPCNGALLPISQYETLYVLIGTTYGGDGVNSFAVPNLQGRVPIGTGQGPALSNYYLGQQAGNEAVTINPNNLPAHSHTGTISVPVSARNGDSGDPTNRYLGFADSTLGNTYNAAATASSNMALSTGTTSSFGQGLPLAVLNPYQAINYCICTVGLFPSRP
jgi:microcystin-dependent protein